MFKTIASHVPPPLNVPSPLMWGEEKSVLERLRNGIKWLRLTRRLISFRFPLTVAEVVEFYRKWYGPTQRAFAALGERNQAKLRHDLECLWADHNQATDGMTHIKSEYLEVIAIRG